MLNRTLTPILKAIESFQIPMPELHIMPNNMELYTINMGDTDVLRIDLLFASGKWDQNKNLSATFANTMMKEGAGNLSSKNIAEHLDYYGAWLQNSVTQHNSYLTLYILNKHIVELLPLLNSIVKEPSFPINEFNTFIQRQKQQFKIDAEKVEQLCHKASMKQLYGDMHPYGNQAIEVDFDLITPTDLRDFHTQHYHSQNCKIMLTGKLTEHNKQLIIDQFGVADWGKTTAKQTFDFSIPSSTNKYVKIEKKDAVQSAIRIATPCIDRAHSDYQGLKVLNTVFGGYFGSRLMKSIREEKGYTYGIGSSISTQAKGSTLSISTQTGSEYAEPLIEAVFDEMKRLQNKKIGNSELACVRNYMLGDFTRSFDGPFAIADAHISLLANNLHIDYFENQIETIRKIDAITIQNLAQEYLNKDQFYIAIAGK